MTKTNTGGDDSHSDSSERGHYTRQQFLGRSVAAGIGVSSLVPALAELVRVAPAAANTAAKQGGTCVCGVVNDVGKFDPAEWGGFTSNIVTNHVFQGLVRLNFATTALEPALAVSWETPDPLTYIYHLRQGVHFHNGDEFSADDVVFSWNRTAKVGWGGYGLINYKGIRKIDKYTVEAKLVKPDWRFKWFGFWPPGAILSKRYVEKVGDTQASASPIGTGAFRVASSSSTKVVLQRFPQYWEHGLPYLDAVDMNVLDETTILAGFRDGSIQLSPDVALNHLSLAASFPNTRVRARVGPHIVLTWMNMLEKPFDDVKVRQAIAEAIDNRSALAAFPSTYYRASQGAMIHPEWQFSDYAQTNRVWNGNLAKARALLKQSSAPNGFKATWVVAATRPQEVAAVLGAQQRLAEIGIDISINQQPDSTVGGMQYQRPRPYQMITYNVLHDRPNALDPLSTYTTDQLAVSNFAGYSNPEYDRVFEQAVTATSPAVLNSAMKKLQQFLVRDVPVIVHGWDAIRRVESTKLRTPPQTKTAEYDDWFRVTSFV
jgi:peptide/nickel transport system substrate-binding protein